MGGALAVLQSLMHAESWKPEHDRVMKQYKDADALSESAELFLYLLDRLKELASRGERTSVSDARELGSLYQSWYKEARLLLDAIEASEANDYPVEKGDALRGAYQSVGSFIDQIGVMQEGIECASRGEGILLGSDSDGPQDSPRG